MRLSFWWFWICDRVILYTIYDDVIPPQPLPSPWSDHLTPSLRGSSSCTLYIVCSVLQGSVLGPSLFTVYTTNSAMKHAVSLNTFADDTQTYLHIHHIDMPAAAEWCISDIIHWCPSTVSSSTWTRLSCCGLDRGKVSLSKTDAFQYYIRGSMMMLYINIFYLLIETDNQMLVVTCSCRKCRPSTLRPRSAFTGISSSWRAEKLENPSSQTDNGRL